MLRDFIYVWYIQHDLNNILFQNVVLSTYMNIINIQIIKHIPTTNYNYKKCMFTLQNKAFI